MQWPSFLLWCTPPFSTFIKSFTSFDSPLLQVLGCLLGPRPFDNPKRPLTYKQAFLPITFNGMGFISTTTIVLTYFGSWALVVSIITTRFMVDQHPFLFETFAWIDNNTFLFQQHFKVTCDLLLSLVHACFFSFEQLIK
jgi:hypothetical protein